MQGQSIEQVHKRLQNTTLEAYNPEIELRIKINIIQKTQEIQLQKCDLGDGLDWYEYQGNYYRMQNGKYLDYDENGNDVVVNFTQEGKAERNIKFFIEDKGIYEYEGILSESQIQKKTNNKLDIFDYFLSLEDDIKKRIYKEGEKSIITIERSDSKPVFYNISMLIEYKPSHQVYQEIFKVQCAENQKSFEEYLLKSNDKWFKAVQQLKKQYETEQEKVRNLQNKIKEQDEQIRNLQRELEQD